MKLVGMMACRNEDWILGCSLRVALTWCDSMVVGLHACTDKSASTVAEVASEHPGRIVIVREDSPNWEEMHHRQRMLEAGRKLGGTHFAVVDADEVLVGGHAQRVRDQIESLPPGGHMHCHMPLPWRSLNQYRVGRSIWANRFDLCLAFKDTAALSWQPTNGYHHHHREPHGSRLVIRSMAISVMHLQFASWRRLVAKHALYKVSERLAYPSKSIAQIDHMYSQALDECGLQLDPVPATWWEPYRDLMQHIHLDREPWQERAVRDLAERHGIAHFAGLNLYGVDQLVAA